MIKVYFDGACKYCSKEIKYYEKIASNGKFQWIDVASNPNALSEKNISQSDALLFLHVIDEKDNIFIGAEAFSIIWKNLPKWKWLGHVIALPLVRDGAKLIYTWFAKRRFQRYSHCQLASKEVAGN